MTTIAGSAIPAAHTPFSAERWRQFWDHWKAQLQQLAGIEQLRQAVMAADPQVLTEAAPWRQTFSSAPPAPAHANPLPVAWENQNDNASGTGYRECVSSSCAMLARYWGKVSGDDAYNVIRARYGNTTSAEAQLAALRSLGLPLRSGGNSLQTPDDWVDRIQGSPLALVVADREADTWAALQRWPLSLGPQASRPHSPVWLALAADWQEHPVLRHIARELGRIGGPQQLEG